MVVSWRAMDSFVSRSCIIAGCWEKAESRTQKAESSGSRKRVVGGGRRAVGRWHEAKAFWENFSSS